MSTAITYLKQDNDTYKVYYFNGVYMGDFYKEIDGYYVWETVLKSGYIPGPLLLILGNKLEELNKPWDDEINEYFDKETDGK